MGAEAAFLRSLFQRSSHLVHRSLQSFDEKETLLYSKTLSRFVESLIVPPASLAARHAFVYGLQKELTNAAVYPHHKPLMHLQSVSHLKLTLFGSTVMGTGLKDGDLDISMTGQYQHRTSRLTIPLKDIKRKELQSNILFDLLKFLRLRNRIRSATNAIVLSKARIPILKFTDRQYGFQCDVSVGNVTGVIRSRILNEILESDARVRSLIYLIKQWAKAQDINDPSKGSFGSYPLTIIVLAFCSEAGLIPSLQNLLPSLEWLSLSDLDHHCRRIARSVRKDKPGLKNAASLLELFLSCLSFMSLYTTREVIYDAMPPNLATCCRGPGIVQEIEEMVGRGAALFVRDPFDPDANCGKPVNTENLHRTAKTLQSHMSDIGSFFAGPKRERRRRWETIFQSLFKTRLRFHGAPESVEILSRDLSKDHPILGIYDDLVRHYVGHSSVNIPQQRAVHGSWFMDRYRDVLTQKRRSRGDQGHIEEGSLFHIKDVPIAIPAA